MSNVKKYRKLPVVIEAIQWNGINKIEIFDFVGKELEHKQLGVKEAIFGRPRNEDWTITIPTLEGDMIAIKDDYIIKGVNGEFYPCKPDIFAKTYEQLESVLEQAKEKVGKIEDIKEKIYEKVQENSINVKFKLISGTHDLSSEKGTDEKELHMFIDCGDKTGRAVYKENQTIGDIFADVKKFENSLGNDGTKEHYLSEKAVPGEDPEAGKFSESKWTDAEKEVVLRRNGWVSNFDGNFWKHAMRFRKDCSLHEAFDLQSGYNQDVRNTIADVSDDVKSKTSYPLTPEEAYQKKENPDDRQNHFLEMKTTGKILADPNYGKEEMIEIPVKYYEILRKIEDIHRGSERFGKASERGYQENTKLMGEYEMISESYWMLVEMKKQMDKLGDKTYSNAELTSGNLSKVVEFPHDLKIVDEAFPISLTLEQAKEWSKAWAAARPKFQEGKMIRPMIFGTAGDIQTKKED